MEEDIDLIYVGRFKLWIKAQMNTMEGTYETITVLSDPLIKFDFYPSCMKNADIYLDDQICKKIHVRKRKLIA